MVRSMHASRGVVRTLAGVSLVAILVAACGGSQSSPAATAAATAAATEAATAAATSAAEVAVYDGTKNYTQLAKAPCDLSGKKIQWLGNLKNHPTLRLWQQGFLDEAKHLGFGSAEIVAEESADWSKVPPLGESLLATGTDGVVLGYSNPIEAGIIKKLGDAGVPVIAAFLYVPEGTYPGLLATSFFLTSKEGVAAADMFGEKMGGKGTVAVTEGSFNEGEDNFAKAFTDRMHEKFPDVKVLPPQEEGFDPPVAIAKAAAILQANPDVTAALSTTGGGPVTWAGAQEETGRKLVATLGPDMSRPNLDLVRDGKITALGAQPGWETHALGVDLIAQKICGATVPYSNELPTPIVFADGLAPYYEVADRVDARK